MVDSNDSTLPAKIQELAADAENNLLPQQRGEDTKALMRHLKGGNKATT